MSTRNPSVIYESQTLTEEQKATVCENIGAQPAVSGKSLSTNDYTNEDQSKLQGIDAGADVNTIESISVDGTAITPDGNKDVAIPIAQSATTDPVASATTGLMSGTDKAKLDAYEAVPAVANRSGKFMKDDGTWDSPKQVHHFALFEDTVEVSDGGTGSTTETYWLLYDLDDPVDTSIDTNGYRKVTLESFASMYDRHDSILLCNHYDDNIDGVVYDGISGVLETAYITRDPSTNPASVTDVQLNFIFANDADGIKFLELSVVSDNYIGILSDGGDPRYSFFTGCGTGLAWSSDGKISVATTGTATGANAFAEGVETTASAQGSHAEGGHTSAVNSWAHAEGYNTEADGNGAHAEGVDTNANEQGAHAGGYGTHTYGVGNFIHGTFLNFDSGTNKSLSKNLPTVVLGTLNATQAQDLTDHGGYLIIVGNGDYKKDGEGTHRDGFILYKDGTVKATAFQNASGTDNAVSYAGTSGVAFNGVNNIEVFAANSVDPSSFPNDGVLRIILES